MMEFNFRPFPLLETKRLLLRKPKISDKKTFFKMRSDEEVMRYVDRPLAQKIEDVDWLLDKMKEDIASNSAIGWAICEKDSGEMIGHMGFWRNEFENWRGEVGYMFLPKAFGKGYATEALHAVIDYGFGVMNLNSVKGCADPENTASHRVMEKVGFVKEAHFREDIMFRGKFTGTVVYCMLKSDWAAGRKK